MSVLIDPGTLTVSKSTWRDTGIHKGEYYSDVTQEGKPILRILERYLPILYTMALYATLNNLKLKILENCPNFLSSCAAIYKNISVENYNKDYYDFPTARIAVEKSNWSCQKKYETRNFFGKKVTKLEKNRRYYSNIILSYGSNDFTLMRVLEEFMPRINRMINSEEFLRIKSGSAHLLSEEQHVSIYLPKILDPGENSVKDEDMETYNVPEGLECAVCQDKPREVLFNPCKHLICCHECSQGQKSCPICRKNINNKTKVYIS